MNRGPDAPMRIFAQLQNMQLKLNGQRSDTEAILSYFLSSRPGVTLWL